MADLPFTVPPLPGEPLLTAAQAARQCGCSYKTIYDKIAAGTIASVRVADRVLIAESELERFIAAWPSKNRGVSGRWRQYREWKAGLHASAEAA